MPALFAAFLVHPQPTKHRSEQALKTSALKHSEKLWNIFLVAPKPLRLPKTKQKKTEESFENNVVKRKSISYAFLRLMTSTEEKKPVGCNLTRSLCHATADTYGQSNMYSLLKLPASLKHRTGLLGQTAAWLPWIMNYLLSHSHSWQCVTQRHLLAEQCYMGHICLTWENILSFHHEFEFSRDPVVRKKIGDFEVT